MKKKMAAYAGVMGGFVDFLFYVCIIVVMLMSGCLSGKTAELMTSYDRANNRDVAISFLKHSDAYRSDGSRLDCLQGQLRSDVYETKCTFMTSDEKYHGVDVTIVGGEVKTAILDGNVTL
jgi:hypothetical protein